MPRHMSWSNQVPAWVLRKHLPPHLDVRVHWPLLLCKHRACITAQHRVCHADTRHRHAILRGRGPHKGDWVW